MKPFSLRTLITAVTTAVTTAALLTGCSKPDPQEGMTSGQTGQTVKAMLVTAQTSTLPILASYPGSVVAEQQIQIASRIMGYVRKIDVESGQTVKQGQLLLTIDPSDIQAQVSMTQAGEAQANAALADAKSDYDRFGELYREEAIPKAQWDKIRLQYTIAQQQANAAHAGHISANEQLRYAEIRAPFAGLVTQRMISVGGLAAPGQALLSLVNPAHLDVETQVSEATYNQLSINEPVSLRIDHVSMTGKITRLVGSADPVSHTHLIKIALPAGSGLQNGRYAQVDFAVGQRPGLRIPSSAVIERAGISGVFVVDKQHIAHYRMVRAGESVNGQTEIQAGLVAGEQVVSAPPAELQSDDTVIAGAGNV